MTEAFGSVTIVALQFISKLIGRSITYTEKKDDTCTH